jgi:hypothetical protein
MSPLPLPPPKPPRPISPPPLDQVPEVGAPPPLSKEDAPKPDVDEEDEGLG